MAFLSYQSWLHPLALILSTIVAIWTVVWIRSWRVVEHKSRWRPKLEVLYEPDNATSPSARTSDHPVEYIYLLPSLCRHNYVTSY